MFLPSGGCALGCVGLWFRRSLDLLLKTSRNPDLATEASTLQDSILAKNGVSGNP